MDKLVVKGGARLKGRVEISGSKNSALPILAATLLTPETCVIRNVPDLSDIRFMLEILSRLGAKVTFENGVVTTRAEKVITEVPYDLVRKMRASICILGPLVARCGQATISEPGGCSIGDRPIDIHLKGLAELGAVSHTEGGNVFIPRSTLIGKEIFLGTKFGSTVLGTDNVMMAAVLAEGTTVIDGAAEEPEVVDLAIFLHQMGAKIEGAGTRRIIIEGVKELHGAEHEVIPDRIEAGTFMVAAAISGTEVKLRRTQPSHLGTVTQALERAGYRIEAAGSTLTVHGNGEPKSLEIFTETYPGFPTDMQAQMCALLARGKGISTITENIFPQRFMHVSELKRMGANIVLENGTAIINGVESLSGAPVMASDLRASAALVLAGLQAEGVTEVNRVYHIDRGYEMIDEKLNGLGAEIERVKVK
jgi:UDP-N-acetylglucosamine 1-carboxyvinyltransferase